MKRAVNGIERNVEEFTTSEYNMNETMKRLLSSAFYDGKLVDKYELLDNAYRATGGFETGEYLIPHPSEGDDKYNRRKNSAYFINYVKPVVDAFVNPIFKTEPIRESMSSLFGAFIKDVDGNNTTLTRFMKKAAIRAKLHGVEFIVVDMERVNENEIITEKEVIDNRLYPYLYLVSPSQITNWATNKFGKLVSISYSLTNNVIDRDGNIQSISEQWTWTETMCKKSISGKDEIFTNQLGIIPIIPLYGAINDSNNLIPQSDVYSIAKTNFAIYNACSELRERNKAQAFSLLTYPFDQESYDTVDEPLRYGTADCLLYDNGSSNRPEFITPPTDSSDIIQSEINFMIKEIYRMANLQTLNGQSQYNISGVVKRYDNQNLYQSITDLAQSLQDVENKIAIVFGKYMGEDLDSYSVAYNTEYGILDTTEVLTNATQSLVLGMTPEYNKEMRIQVAKATLDGINPEILSRIVEGLANAPESGNALEGEATVVQPRAT